MKPLAPELFDLRYDALVELARSRLPALAPAWTDHNAHDPGITLMELLAWVTEAQLYALGHPRRDERRAYAALLGVKAAGTTAARGLLWSGAGPEPAAGGPAGPRVIGQDAPVRPVDQDRPEFRPVYKTLWAPGRVTRLWTRGADGRVRDHSAANARGGVAFLPFGEAAGPREVLTLEYETHAPDGIVPAPPTDRAGLCWLLGVCAAEEGASKAGSGEEDGLGVGDAAPARGCARPWPFEVTLVAGEERQLLPLVADTSRAMAATGALVLDVSALQRTPQRFALELRAPRGLARAARLLRIEPNVLAIEQRRPVVQEQAVQAELPDLAVELDTPGLCFGPGEAPLRVSLLHQGAEVPWQACERLADQGPQDPVYELDAVAGWLRFGNGVNGRRPPAGSVLRLSYAVSDGVAGNVPRRRVWVVAGMPERFGLMSLDPVAGGADRWEEVALRREARHRARDAHALVSAADIVAAALALPWLGVGRAWRPLPRPGAAATGTVELIVMQRRVGPEEPAQPPETARWLEAVRAALAPRMPLGTRLQVHAPRYVDFTLRARLRAVPGSDPVTVRGRVHDALARRLALLPPEPAAPRAPGVPVTARDLRAWMRQVDGVADVEALTLSARRGDAGRVPVPEDGLPRLDLGRSDIDVQRPAPAGREP